MASLRNLAIGILPPGDRTVAGAPLRNAATTPNPSHSWASPAHGTDTTALAEALRLWPATEAFALP